MAGGAAVHLVPLRVAQIMQQILRQAGSKNGLSSWVSRGEAQAPCPAPWEQRGLAREMASAAPKLLSSWHCCFMKKISALKIL